MPYMGKATTDGGIHIPDSVRDREALATVVAYVLKIGPLAYQDPHKFGETMDPWCKEGQWVCIGRYAGARFLPRFWSQMISNMSRKKKVI